MTNTQLFFNENFLLVWKYKRFGGYCFPYYHMHLVNPTRSILFVA